MIEVNRVSRDYAGQRAVDEVSFTIGKGEIVGLLGHNGAGKSTVMKMLTGYLEPTSGDIRIAGRSMLHEAAAIRGLIGYLPENCPLHADMRVMDYLYFQADLKGIDPAMQDENVLSVLRRTQIEARATSRIATLSRGLRQRVGVAQALLARPRILILDEPTNGLDPAQGPGLVFVSLPIAFGSVTGGLIFGTLFFTLLLFAADKVHGYRVMFSPACPGLSNAKALSFVTEFDLGVESYNSILLDNGTRCYFNRVVPTVFD